MFPPSFFSSSVTFSSPRLGIFTIASYVPVGGVVWAKAMMLPTRNVSVSINRFVLCFTGLFLSENLRRLISLFTFERILGLGHDLGKRFGLMHGEVREHLSIELESGEFETMHEL